MNSLSNELILHISSFLDDFQITQLSFVSKQLYRLLFCNKKRNIVVQQIHQIQSLKHEVHRYITRINLDGVVLGYCQQCFQIKLLYTYNDGFVEKTICVDDCELYCTYCDILVRFHHIEKGCPRCLNML